MVKQVVDTILPTTMVGSYPRPAWFTQQLLGRDIRVAFKEHNYEETFQDAVATIIRDQEEAGLDIVTDGNMWYDDYVGVIGSFCWYLYERIPGFEPSRNPHPSYVDADASQGKAIMDDWGGVINSGPVDSAPDAIRWVDLYEMAQARSNVPVKASIGAGPANLAWHVYFNEDSHYKSPKDLTMALVPIFNKEMKALVAEAMEHGAMGISTGLFYVPGSFTPTEEVVELSRIVAGYGGIYISHMRDETTRMLDSVDETIRIGVEAGLPVQITHHKAMGTANWGDSVKSLERIDAARARGIDVTMDQYPYTASQTGIFALVPQWAQAGGDEALLERWEDPDTRRQIKDGIVDRILNDRGGGDPANVVISLCEWDASLNGKSLAEILLARGRSPTPENAADLTIEIIRGGGAQAVYHAMDERDVERIMQHPATAIGSDGPLGVFGAGAPHPRQYGTFARVLGRYVREREILTLEEAVRKMTSATAQRLSIRDRGLLREGYYADIAIIDAEVVRDLATFEDPHQYAEGVEFVLVNGEIVVEQGKHTGARPGRVLHGPGYRAD